MKEITLERARRSERILKKTISKNLLFRWKIKFWWNFKNKTRIKLLKCLVPLIVSEMTVREINDLLVIIDIYLDHE